MSLGSLSRRIPCLGRKALLGAWKQAQRDSEACCPGAATMATKPGLCPLLAPLDGWSTRDPSTCPRHHLPSLPPC